MVPLALHSVRWLYPPLHRSSLILPGFFPVSALQNRTIPIETGIVFDSQVIERWKLAGLRRKGKSTNSRRAFLAGELTLDHRQQVVNLKRFFNASAHAADDKPVESRVGVG